MKSFQDYISESQLLSLLERTNTKRNVIKLPYTFDIYNKGPKNTDFKITKLNIYKVFFGAETDDKGFDQMIRLPLPANKINYAEVPTSENTDNWTKIPEIREYTYCGGWYSDKWVEYGYSEYNKDWNEYLTSLFKDIKSKVSVTVTEDPEDKTVEGTRLVFTINNDKFNKEREERIKELSDPKHLKEWKDEADAAEKKRIEDEKKRDEEKKKAEKEWAKWWNSLSDGDRLSWTMGYGRGSGTWTGD